MKAAICREFGKPLEIEEVRLAEPEQGQVQVKLKACAICHSDLSYADGHWGGELPAVYGHEGAGIVTAVGGGVTGYRVGDHVIVTLIRHCGSCGCCEREQEALCDDVPNAGETPITAHDGSDMVQAMNCGAFAESVTVHQSQLAIVPDDMPFDVASLLACGVITGYGAVTRSSSLVEGRHAIVIGCGGVGFNSIQAAHHMGAASVIAMDLSSEKMELAKQFGATHAVNPTDGDAVQQVMDITGGGADVVFVAVGAKAAIDSASSFIAKLGQIVIVGMPPSGVMSEMDSGTMAAWGQTIVGSKMGGAKISEDIPMLVGLYQQGRLKLDELISGRYRLDQINEALDGVRKGEAVKNVIVFD